MFPTADVDRAVLERLAADGAFQVELCAYESLLAAPVHELTALARGAVHTRFEANDAEIFLHAHKSTVRKLLVT